MTAISRSRAGRWLPSALLALGAVPACLVLGLAAIRRIDLPAHQAWMIRAYALAVGAGTQVFTLGVNESLLGASPLTSGLALGAGWVINLAVGEYAIARMDRSRSRRPLEVRVA